MSTATSNDRTNAAISRSNELVRRAVESTARAGQLQAEAHARCLALARLRLDIDRHRRSRARLEAKHVRINVEGIIDGRTVGATWIDGDLGGDEDLISRAELLVALGEQWERSSPESGDQVTVTATLAGPPYLVALTLARACTRVTSITVPI